MITIPNLLTLSRIFGSLFMFVMPSFSFEFLVLYTLCGLTDALDGHIARKTKTTSELGARLDSIADLVFYFMMVIKLFTEIVLHLPRYIVISAFAVFGIRLVTYLTAAIKYHRFASMHTYLNKATGILVFFIPYLLHTPVFSYFGLSVCIVALAAALEELYIHLTHKEYSRDIKSIFIGRF